MFDETVHAVLFLGVACQLVCVLGTVLMRSVFDRLHYAAAGSTLGPSLVGGAIVARQTVHPHTALELSPSGLETLFAVLFVLLLSPAPTILLARAARREEYGSLEARPEEKVVERPG